MRPLLLLSLLCLAATSLYPLNVSGVISKPASWGPSDNPVVVTGHVEIPESSSLKINAGTVVRFDGYFHILVKGALEAEGKADNEIEFTSNKEKPATEDWEGLIFFGEKSRGYLTHCRIRYAFKNFLWKSSPVIQGCYFSANNYAIYCSYAKATKILENQIVKNTFGIYCDFSSPVIQKNKIMNNSYGIYCVLSSSPVVGENEIASNTEKDIFTDESMGKNQTENINNQVWDLMKGLF
jgi:parallel beta-helix repeat protein